MDKVKIKTKVAFGLPITKKERALYLLFIATVEEMNAFLHSEKKNED